MAETVFLTIKKIITIPSLVCVHRWSAKRCVRKRFLVRRAASVVYPPSGQTRILLLKTQQHFACFVFVNAAKR